MDCISDLQWLVYSIFDQWLLWSGSGQGLLLLYRHDHVDAYGNFIIGRNTEHDDSKNVMHGYVEDMELSDTTQVTGDQIAVHVTSQTLYTSHWRSLMH